MNVSVKLSGQELDWALGYLESGGSSFAYPEPFELAALRHSWDKVRPALERVELLAYDPQPCVQMSAPKQRFLVRPVHLLDPIDALFYTGLTFRLAPGIEATRARYKDGRVFSYRLNPGKLGSKESFVSDWDARTARLEELCSQHRFVGATDIVDFFPRIYLHRLQNSLEAVSGDVYGTRALMRLVQGWSAGTSYGIPTGPQASNYLAEALLIEVDEYLLNLGMEFVRWVDDYWVFGDTEPEVVAGLFRLGERLHETQGLSLNPAKTHILTSVDFWTKVLHRSDPVAEWRADTLDEILEEYGPYASVNIDDLRDDQIEAIDALDARSILEGALAEELVDLHVVKFILQFLSTFRRPELVGLVLDNLPLLMPMGDSVARFLDALDGVDEADHEAIGERLTTYIAGGGFVPEFQTMWLLDPFTRSANWGNLAELRHIARDTRSPMIRRQAILGIMRSGDRSAILDAKTALGGSRDWEERAILLACSRLPADERDAIIAQAGGTGGSWTVSDCLKKSVLAYMKTDS